jgi:hypothetical protein
VNEGLCRAWHYFGLEAHESSTAATPDTTSTKVWCPSRLGFETMMVRDALIGPRLMANAWTLFLSRYNMKLKIVRNDGLREDWILPAGSVTEASFVRPQLWGIAEYERELYATRYEEWANWCRPSANLAEGESLFDGKGQRGTMGAWAHMPDKPEALAHIPRVKWWTSTKMSTGR